MNRKEAIELIAELGSCELVNPDLVDLELKSSEKYQLKIKGNYNVKDVEFFLEKQVLR